MGAREDGTDSVTRIWLPLLLTLVLALPVRAQDEQDGEEADEGGEEGESESEIESEIANERLEESRERLLTVLPPVLDEIPPPVFPDEALAAGVEGTVVLRLSLDATGAVTAAEIVREPGHGLGEAARAAALQASFDPATAGGRPVPYERLYFKVAVDHPDLEPPPLPEGEMAGELTQMPVLTEFVPAEYPPELKDEGIEGRVVLEILVNEYGEVSSVRIAEHSGYPAFDESALDAAWRFEFEPGYAGPVPVAVAIAYEYVFALEEKVVESVAETGYDEVDPDGPVNYQGVVRERGTRDPMPNIEVYLEEFELSAITDERGRFEFRGIPVGTFHVLILAPGFEPFQTEEDVFQGELTDVVYFVRPSPVGANRTIVRVKKERKEVSRTTLTIEEIQQVPGTFGDPIKVVQNLPGVARSPFDFGILIVRGSGPEDTGTYVDGLRVPLLYHFGGFRSVISPIMIDAIDFYPGGYGPRWGRTMGGVMNVGTKREWPDVVHGLVRLDLIDAEAALVGPIKRQGEKIGGFGAAGRRSYIDLMLPVLAPPSVDLSRTVLPQWWDAQAKVAIQPSKQVDLWAFLYASDDQTSQVSDQPLSEQSASSSGFAGFRTSFFRATVGGAVRPHPNVDLDWRFGYSYDAIKIAAGSAFNVATASNFFYGRLDGTWSPAEWTRGHVGFDYAGGTDQFELFSEGVVQAVQDPTGEGEDLLIVGDTSGSAPAWYVEGEFMPFPDRDRLKLIPGVRLDYYRYQDGAQFVTLDPRFTARLRVYETTYLKGSAGLYHQTPQPWELFEGIGNPDLKPERSPQFVVGVEQQFTPFLSLDAQFFYKWMENLVILSFRDVDEASDVWKNKGVGRVIGGEFFLRWRMHRNFFGWISYTVSRSTRQDWPDEDWYVYEFDQPHILDVVAAYEFPYHITVSARFRLTSGNPTTPYMGAMLDVDRPGYDALFGEYNSQRMPTFHQLDVRIDKTFIFRKWRIMAYLEILNVYNRQNPEFELYNFDYTEKDYLNGLPFIPNLGLRAEF